MVTANEPSPQNDSPPPNAHTVDDNDPRIDNADVESDPTTGSIGRRVIVKGAAWSIPVFAAATAVPLAAASVCTPGTYTAPAPPRGANVSDAKVTSSFIVPPGVRTISYQVAGGAGGTAGTSGAGDLVTGTLTVIPGDVLTLVVGQGGVRKSLDENSIPGTLLTGGKGFGDGGDSNGVPASTTPSAGTMLYNQGGSGGGGSAIQLNGSVAVVASGGNGQGTNQGQNGQGVTGEWTTSNIPNGSRWTHSTRGVWVQSTRGGDASGATPGTAGNVTGGAVQGTAETPVSLQNTFPGSAGGGVSPNGGKGGDSQPIWLSSPVMDTVLVSTPGAGGGGYSGGGSGGITNAVFDIDGSNRLMDQSSSSGGRGASYLAPGVVGTISSAGANNSAASPQRGPGYITLSWSC